MARSAITLTTTNDIDMSTTQNLSNGRYIDCRYLDYVTFQGKTTSTTAWGVGVLTVKVSNNARDWYTVPGGSVTLTAEGITAKIEVYAFRYVGVFVTTVVANLTVQVIVHGEGQSADADGTPSDSGIAPGGFMQLGKGNFVSGIAGYTGSSTAMDGLSGPPL